MPVPKEVVDYQFTQFPHEPLPKREVECLPEVLYPGEVMYAAISGVLQAAAVSGVPSRWLVVATSRRILFVDKGVLSGLKVVDLPIDKIDGVAQHAGMMQGELTITTAGAAWKVTGVHPKTAPARFAQVVDWLRQQVSQQRAAPPAQAVPAAPQEDFISRLERLGTLRQSGVLTEEEFQSQKQRVLNGG